MILEPVKIAVIGCGGYAFQLIKRVMSVPHSGVVAAVTSRDVTSPGAQFCRDRGIAVFQTIDELLDYGEFEVVINPTPIHLHSPTTKQCLQAGFPVWLEKPPVATVQELDSLQALAEETGKPIAICFNSLFAHIVQNLKKELVAGRYGRVRQVKGSAAWIRTSAYFDRNNWAGCLKKDGDWILDGDINNPLAHVLCNNLFFAASEHHKLAQPASIEAELYRCNNIESEDTSCLRIKATNGVDILSYLTLSTKQETTPRTVIETEKALITFEDFNRLRIEFYNGATEEHEAYQENRIEMLEHLCRAFRTGKPYLSTLDMMRPFTVTVNGAFDSAGSITSIPAEFIENSEVDDVPHRSIKGIGNAMHDAFESNSLYSEIGVPWAKMSEKFDTTEYTHFPQRFEAPGSVS
ncbi:MAG: Gfo/Idh/MocA family protein [Puniceicoccaceae bacterium]